MYHLVILAVVLIAFPTDLPGQESSIAKLTQRVTDVTGTLSQAEIRTLENHLAIFEDSTSTQIVVVLLGSVAGESIEDVSMRVAEQNKIGSKGRDNGVLLLIARDDRLIRIEVGYGLEGTLPDALASSIIRNEITPYFRTGNYYGGIVAGVNAIMSATRNEYTADQKGKRKENGGFPLLLVLLILFFVLNGLRRRRSGGFLGGMGPIVTSGLGGMMGSKGGSWGGGFGGGGFSGGGGSFGGGGASGRW